MTNETDKIIDQEVTKSFNMSKWRQRRQADQDRIRDTDGISIGLREKYILKLKWEYIRDADEPYFFGGDNFATPDMVYLASDATVFEGRTLLNINWPWYNRYEAVRIKNYEN